MKTNKKDLYIEIDNRLDENNVFLSIKWTPTSGVLRPDGRRLRGKFKVSKIKKADDDSILVVLNNGMVLKVDPSLPLEKQGFKFRLQHTEPMTLKQAYEYINDIKELPVKSLLGYVSPKKESIYFDNISPENIIKEFKINKNNFFEIILENNDKILLDPDAELKNPIFNFYNENSKAVNIFEAVVLHYGIGFRETLTGYEIDYKNLQEDIIEEGPINWLKNLMTKGVTGVAAERAGKKMQKYASQSIYNEWLRWVGKSGANNSPKNLISFLKSDDFDPKLIKIVASEANTKFGLEFPLEDYEKTLDTESYTINLELSKFNVKLTKIFDKIKETLDKIKPSDSDNIIRDKKEYLVSLAEEFRSTRLEIKNFLTSNRRDLEIEKVNGIISRIRVAEVELQSLISTAENNMVSGGHTGFTLNLRLESKNVEKNNFIVESKFLLKESEDKLTNNEVKEFFRLVVQLSVTKNINIPPTYRHLLGHSYEDIYGEDEGSKEKGAGSGSSDRSTTGQTSTDSASTTPSFGKEDIIDEAHRIFRYRRNVVTRSVISKIRSNPRGNKFDRISDEEISHLARIGASVIVLRNSSAMTPEQEEYTDKVITNTRRMFSRDPIPFPTNLRVLKNVVSRYESSPRKFDQITDEVKTFAKIGASVVID